jgi:hypothetical protein
MDVENQAYIQLRAEERLRSGSDIKAAEEEIQPQFRYDYIWNEGVDHFTALYNPRLIYTSSWDRRFPDPNRINPTSLNLTDPNKTPFSMLQNGGIGYERVRPRWRLTLYAFGAYGTISTTALLVQAPWTGEGPPPDPAPIIPATIGARFTLLFESVQLFVPIKLSSRTALIPGIKYDAFGGADQESRGVIALSQGPSASIQLDHAATHEDRLITTLGAGRTDNTFQDAQEQQTIYRAQLVQAWRHYFSFHTYSELSGGVQVGGDNVNGYSVYSQAEALLLWDSWPLAIVPPGAAPFGGEPGHGGHWQLAGLAKVEPWIDIFSGELEQRAVLGGAANYGYSHVNYRASLSYAEVVNTPQSVAQYKIILGETALKYNFVNSFSADIGVRVGFQDFDNAIRFNTLTQATAFAGLTYAPLPARWNP